jgi:hypothetical protein
MLDGSTSGPNTYKGIIGSAIEKDNKTTLDRIQENKRKSSCNTP